MSDIVHTPEQARAIASSGNVLVMAGAGTGKTRTLVERCLAHVARAEDPVPLDAVLLVTFTEAAAAEMRQRLRAALEKLVAAHPERPQLAAQLVLVETAHIQTLHGFCLQLVRDHFHELAIDPELTVLPNDRARLLAEETLDALMREQYEGDTPAARAVHEMLLDFDRARDTALRDLVLRLHHYTQSLADPEGWYERQRETLLAEEPRDWPAWLGEAFAEWRERWLPPLDAQPAANTKASLCARTLREAGDRPARDALAQALAGIAAADAEWPRGLPKKKYRKPIEKFFEEAAFLRSLAGTDPAGAAAEDPLVQDWRWVRGPLLSLVDLAREFSRRFAAARREQGALDFHDLEQLALQLLWDRQAQAPTAIACQWRERLPLLFIDEYQDINEAQDRILGALGRPDATGNRFLVGDVKQSIYRFRLANPRIFQDYAVRWGRAESGGQALPLTGNFRSAPGILEFVNRLFTPLMRRSVGGIDYTEDQWLRPGAASAPVSGEIDGVGAAPVELQLLLTRSSRGSPASDDDTTAIEKEAWLVAERLRALHAEGVRVRDRESGVPGPVRWGDMAVLMRAPGMRAEAYARMFQQCGVPLLVARTGFYDSLEIRDLLGLLQLLDNPLQDQPLVAVLRSPLAGLSPDELACVRLAQRSGALWTALLRFHARGEANAARNLPDAAIAIQAFRKVHTFLGLLGPWRELCRVAPLSECVESILDGSGYESWLAAQPRGAEAMANVRRLLALTRQFDQFQRQGLHRFLRFVEARRELDIDLEPGVSETVDAVRLLSVHQSKGLEFPIVVVADCGHAFNLRDLSARVILDERFGLCSLVQPPGVPARYPSLPHWMASRHQRKEALGEEMRLLYVALTRARDRLILSGIATVDDAAAGWAADTPGAAGFTPHQILSAGRWLDWLGPWLCSVTGHTDWTRPGGDTLVQWHAVEAEDGRFASAAVPQALAPVPAGPDWLADPGLVHTLRERCAWRYGHRAASEEAAKASVSQLRRRAAAEDATEARPWFDPAARAPSPAAHALQATQLGIAHHRVLETVRLDLPVTRHSLRNAVTHLREVGALSAIEENALDFEALEAFWVSDLGQAIQSKGKSVERELPFTVRLTPADVAGIGLPLPSGLSPDEFIVVQGVADLVVVLPEALWLLDFKTDRVGEADLAARVSAYAPQVKMYALALGRIYRRPVTRGCLHFLAARRTVEIPLFTGLSVPQP